MAGPEIRHEAACGGSSRLLALLAISCPILFYVIISRRACRIPINLLLPAVMFLTSAILSGAGASTTVALVGQTLVGESRAA